MDEMKPCPFCGKRGRIKKYSDDRYRAVCSNHICPVESFDYHTAKEAQDWWNKRHDPERDRWISVRERAPAHGETVIVTDGEIVCDALFGGFTQVTKSLYFEPSESIEHITHWMPLPEPPKEET